MTKYEYIRIKLPSDYLETLNQYGETGWSLRAIVNEGFDKYAVFERKWKG